MRRRVAPAVALLVAATAGMAPAAAGAAVPHWSVVASPNPATDVVDLYDVDCLSATDCIAAGVGDHAAISLRWDGSSWTPLAVPLPGGISASTLQGISCTTTTCMAVGSSTNATTRPRPLAVRGWGASWSALRPPVPAGADDASLAGVSCSSATDCFAVGVAHIVATGSNASLIERGH